MPDASLKNKRPLWYNLNPLNLPLPGLVSILHRISGAALFLGLVWFLFLLDMSLASEDGYARFTRYVSQPLVKLALAVLLWAYLHHFCAGIRYLFLDIDKGVDLATARATSGLVLVVSLALTALLAWGVLW
ncbi:MAG: succinate dehydrogenase, cytochrome b556 subunit [Burkholderiales bacterium]